jgi:hypothetical protein
VIRALLPDPGAPSITDPDASTNISARRIFSELHRVLSPIIKDDVLATHEQSYGSTE